MSTAKKNPVARFLGRKRWRGVSKKEHSEFASKSMTNWWSKQSKAYRKRRGKLMTEGRLRKRAAKNGKGKAQTRALSQQEQAATT